MNVDNQHQAASGSAGAQDRQTLRERLLRDQIDLLIQKQHEVLVQMAGSIAHEISQPLTVILSNIELLKMRNLVDEGRARVHFQRIGDASETISEIVKRVQTIYQPRYEGQGKPQRRLEDFRDPLHVALMAEDEELCERVVELLKQEDERIEITQVAYEDLSIETLRKIFPDIVLIDFGVNHARVHDFIQTAHFSDFEIPIVLAIDEGADNAAAGAIRSGVVDYVPKRNLTRGSLSRLVRHSLSRFWLGRLIRRFEDRLRNKSPREPWLCNRFSFEHILESEWGIARGGGMELTLVAAKIKDWEQMAANSATLDVPTCLGACMEAVRASLDAKDVCVRLRDGFFAMLLLPEFNFDDSRSLCGSLQEALSAVRLKAGGNDLPCRVRFAAGRLSAASVESPGALWEVLLDAVREGKTPDREVILID